jgi:hypothetical protein
MRAGVTAPRAARARAQAAPRPRPVRRQAHHAAHPPGSQGMLGCEESMRGHATPPLRRCMTGERPKTCGRLEYQRHPPLQPAGAVQRMSHSRREGALRAQPAAHADDFASRIPLGACSRMAQLIARQWRVSPLIHKEFRAYHPLLGRRWHGTCSSQGPVAPERPCHQSHPTTGGHGCRMAGQDIQTVRFMMRRRHPCPARLTACDHATPSRPSHGRPAAARPRRGALTRLGVGPEVPGGRAPLVARAG